MRRLHFELLNERANTVVDIGHDVNLHFWRFRYISVISSIKTDALLIEKLRR